MKKLLLILLMVLLPIAVVPNGNKGFPNETKTFVNYYPTVMYQNWTLIGTPSWTTPSFYFCVTRSQYLIDGYYYFDIWFTSNTYTWDYHNNKSVWRYVYLENFKLSYDGYMTNNNHPLSFSFLKDYNPQQLRWRTTNSNPIYKYSWTNFYGI